MKRSAQVALLFGGLAAAGGGAYAMMPARQECLPPRAAPQGTTAPGIAAPAPTPVPGIPAAGVAAAGALGQAAPCEPRRRSGSIGFYGGGYYGDRGYRSRTIWRGGSSSSTARTSTPSSTSVAIGSRTGTSTSSSSSGRSSYGGFGSTGSSAGRSSS